MRQSHTLHIPSSRLCANVFTAQSTTATCDGSGAAHNQGQSRDFRGTVTAAHPDRADRRDPVAFAQAAEAYTALRTAAGGQPLADPPRPGGQPRAWTPVPGRKDSLARLLLAGGLPIRHGLAVISGTLTWP